MAKEKYTMNLRFEGTAKTEVEAVIGVQQTKVVERIFADMNKFKKGTVLTILPELMAQLSNIVANERVNIIKRHGVNAIKVIEEMEEHANEVSEAGIASS